MTSTGKIARTREFVSGALSRGEIEPDDAVVFTDGFDSFVARPAGGAARALLAATPPGSVLFSAERGCWPDAALAVRFPEPPRGALAAAGGGRYRYLNAGGYGGRARDVSALLEAVWSDALSATASGEGLAADDQLLFQRRLLAQHEAGLGSGLETECPAIELDYACQVFQANAGEDVDDASSEPVLQVRRGMRGATLQLHARRRERRVGFDMILVLVQYDLACEANVFVDGIDFPDSILTLWPIPSVGRT